eukprot:Skav223150  [mRNA]  locus=scaffold2431:62094:68143:- [translate_table: standard]
MFALLSALGFTALGTSALAQLDPAPFGPQGLSGRGLRFVVHRGTEGFGDRLQQLLMAMRYARATGRALVTDWRDDKFQRERFRYHLEYKIDGYWNNLKFPDEPSLQDNKKMEALANGEGEDYEEEVVVFAGDQYRPQADEECPVWGVKC